MTEALVALGGNVGDSRGILSRAVDIFCDGVDVKLVVRSSDYRTPPWGFKYQPPFVNLCIAVKTALPPRQLLEHAQAVELQLGRDRAHEKRWGPRTADIDILTYGSVRMNELGLTLPHPRLLERAFVLVPLAEIAGDRIVDGRTIADLAAAVDPAGIEKLPQR